MTTPSAGTRPTTDPNYSTVSTAGSSTAEHKHTAGSIGARIRASDFQQSASGGSSFSTLDPNRSSGRDFTPSSQHCEPSPPSAISASNADRNGAAPSSRGSTTSDPDRSAVSAATRSRAEHKHTAAPEHASVCSLDHDTAATSDSSLSAVDAEFSSGVLSAPSAQQAQPSALATRSASNAHADHSSPSSCCRGRSH